MKRCFVFNRGFAGTYYLAVLLVVSLCCTAVMLNDANRLRSMILLKVSQKFFLQEQTVIEDLRCRLQQEWEEGAFDTAVCSYFAKRKENMVYVTITGELPETMTILTDRETGLPEDYEASRDQTVIDSYLH